MFFFNWRAIHLRVKNLVYPLQSSFKLFLLKLSRDRTFITHTVEVLQFKGVVYIQIFNLPITILLAKGENAVPYFIFFLVSFYF